MKSIVNIVIDKTVDKQKYNLNVSLYSDDYDLELKIVTNGSESIDELINDNEDLRKEVKSFKDYLKMGIIENYNVYDLSDTKSLLDSIDLYRFDASTALWNDAMNDLDYRQEEEYSNEDIIRITHDYIVSHDDLKDKKVAICDRVGIDTDIKAIMDKYPGFKHLYVLPEGGMEPLPIEDTKNSIFTFIKSIKELNLSPLETAIIVYDFVREKVYKHEKNSESYSSSRDLYQAVKDDDIVCMGYSTIYDKIMNDLGIKCGLSPLNGLYGEAGHIRNVIKIDDDKYNVHGLFILDPTFDSRNKKDNNEWLYRYRFFLKKRKDFVQVDKANNLDDVTFGYLDNHSIENVDELFEIYSKNPIDMLIKNNKVDDDYNKARKIVNILDSMYENVSLDDSTEKRVKIFRDNVEEIIHDYNEKIELSTFVKALIRVRYIESKIDPKMFEYNISELFRNIPGYGFDESDEDMIIDTPSAEELLLKSIFGEDYKKKSYVEEDRKKQIAYGYRRMCKNLNDEIIKEDKAGRIKVVKSIKLYERKSKKKNQ